MTVATRRILAIRFGMGVALCNGTCCALADDAPQSVVVVGTRASLDAAQRVKQARDEIGDSVVADDIDKLPDISVAEALQRIPGIQITRDRGEGSGVVVRGLTQVETTLDGREAFTAGAGRSLDFTEVPSELVAGLDVIKTASANRIEGGIGGQIDLRTRRPFDFEGNAAEATVRTMHAELADATDTQFSGLLSRRFATGAGEFGLLVTFARQSRPWREDQKSVGNPVARTDLVAGETVLAPNGTSETTSAGRRDRDATQLVAQWRPNAAWELYAQAADTRLKTIQDSYQINIGASSTFDPNSVVLFPGTNDVERITWTDAPISVLSFARDTAERTRLVAAGGEWKDDALTVRADVSRTASKESLFFSGPFTAGTAARFTQDLSTYIPSSSVTGTDLLSTSTYTYTGLAYRVQPFGGGLNAARVDVERSIDTGWIRAISAGVRLATRDASDDTGLIFGDLSLSGPSVADLSGLAVANPYANFLPGYAEPSLRNFIVGNLALARDPAALRAAFGITTALPTAGSPLGVWRIVEQTRSAYLMANIDALDSALSGNVGLRLAQTHESLSGYESVPDTGGTQPLAQASRYLDVLPSFNLRYALGDDRFLRVAASRTITRPDFNQLSPSLTLLPNSVDPSLDTGSAGNPNLRPVRATGLDVAWETYARRPGDPAAAITLFVKHVDGFVTTVSAPETYDGATYEVSRPHNALPADLHGVEAAWQQFFPGLPGVLGGLGVQLDATMVDSSTPNSSLGANVPLSNLSRYSANAIGMYERDGVSGRLAFNWRDRYLSSVTQIVGVGALPIYVRSYGWLDASLGYRVNDHLTITVTGSNLLNTVRRSDWGSATLPQSVWMDDRQFALAMAFRL